MCKGSQGGTWWGGCVQDRGNSLRVVGFLLMLNVILGFVIEYLLMDGPSLYLMMAGD